MEEVAGINKVGCEDTTSEFAGSAFGPYVLDEMIDQALGNGN